MLCTQLHARLTFASQTQTEEKKHIHTHTERHRERHSIKIRSECQWIEMTCRFKQKVNKEQIGLNMISSHWRGMQRQSRERPERKTEWNCTELLSCTSFSIVAIYWWKSALLLLQFHFKIAFVMLFGMASGARESVPMTCVFYLNEF